MKDSSNLLDEHALKKTPFRRELLKIFSEAGTPLTAAQILELMKKNKRLKGVVFDRATLFRNLKTLVEKQLLNSTEFGTGSAFYCLSHKDHHHHHIFCVRCETVKAFDTCAVGPMIELASK